MSKTTVTITTVSRWVVYLILLAVPASGHASPLREPASPCADATPLEINSTERVYGIEDGDEQIFAVEARSPGLLTLDVSAPGTSPAEPMLGLLGPPCEAKGAAGRVSVIERSAASLALKVLTPGVYAFRVGAQDPRLRLAETKLRTAFVEGFVDKSGDPNEDEPDPEPLVSGGGEKSGDPNEDEPDPEPLAGPPSKVLAELCLAVEVDDHGDTAACATPVEISRAVTGEIANDWGDDEDYFLFVLTALSTVEIETTGASDTAGGLYDRFGHRLAMDDDGGDGDNFRIVKTLSAGRYYVRIEGPHRAEGAYRLAAESLSWP